MSRTPAERTQYYLTALGKQVVALGPKLKELVIIPELAAVPPR